VEQESVLMVKDLFRDAEQTEFVIATIPTVLGVNESARLATSLKADSIPCRRIIVNQASNRRATSNQLGDVLCVSAFTQVYTSTAGVLAATTTDLRRISFSR
jgi:anion-transporting  ArsA/GET3 family ATPase